MSDKNDRQQEEQLYRLRHSASHVMAQAVLEKFPEGKIAIGPPIENGFYYDFDLSRPLTPEDMEEIEARMREIIAEGHDFEYKEIDEDEARRMFADQPYKLELIDDILSAETEEAPKLSIYRQGPFVDLCRGPHVDNTRKIKINAFKLLSVAGAYWRGDERRPMLQRIYGTAWSTRKQLKKHLQWLEEIEKRDHRKLIKQLDLVSFHEEGGAGLAYWHPKAGRMRVLIEDYWRERHYEGGYDIVFSPHIGRAQLWETSGHLDFYKEGMYAPMDIDGQEYYIKPMNCPFHILIYKAQLRSYRELPLRWAELGTVYRYERSGTLHGLLRVRGFTQDDAHIFCTPEQIEGEILRVLDFSLSLLRGFGFEEFKIELSVRDPGAPEKYAGADSMWEQAEASLVKALEARDLDYERMEGEAVFYGPKIDIKIKDALGRAWQCTTIQFDFNLPERFDMTYVGEDGKEHRPYMVHRALLGSLERFFGVLVEHYGGAFPAWLSPVQAIVIPIADRHLEYARSAVEQLRAAGLRVEVDTSSERMQAKIRDAQVQKIPYMLIIGDRELEADQVNLRMRDGNVPGAMSIDEFLTLAQEAVAEKRLL
ncbi:MAG: threonine--tRNA ligase [Chloroflexi bacterium]|nr:MAG: threonine--tRNA ligase [Anaerolineaceae bacterium 4572_32.2]RLC86572.1 MAG: threonine--tRNA ligase [Chloroflexota bacterium]HEY74319.1 threonine--tRNA ligase [Thermoflexia bacterium]